MFRHGGLWDFASCGWFFFFAQPSVQHFRQGDRKCFQLFNSKIAHLNSRVVRGSFLVCICILSWQKHSDLFYCFLFSVRQKVRSKNHEEVLFSRLLYLFETWGLKELERRVILEPYAFHVWAVYGKWLWSLHIALFSWRLLLPAEKKGPPDMRFANTCVFVMGVVNGGWMALVSLYDLGFTRTGYEFFCVFGVVPNFILQ